MNLMVSVHNRACQKNDTIVAVCHVLRYFPPAVKIREIVESGALGEVVVINHTGKEGDMGGPNKLRELINRQLELCLFQKAGNCEIRRSHFFSEYTSDSWSGFKSI